MERHEKTGSLFPKPWNNVAVTLSFPLQLPSFVSDVIERMRDADYETYIVGGALRDTLLHNPVPDWDLSTSATSEQINSLFTDTKHYQLRHETVTLVVQGQRLEITPFRGTERTILGDLAKRDFTINAMAHDPLLQILIDPWEGKKDLERKLVRATGDPGSRFQEDPIRLLRGIRLAIERDFRIERDTLTAIRSMASSISFAPWERIRDELSKILMCETPSRGFNMLSETGLLKHILPELREGKNVEQNRYHRFTVFEHTMETLDKMPAVLHLRWAALLHDIGKPRVRSYDDDQWRFYGHEEAGAKLCEEIMRRLRLPRPLIRSVVRLVRYHMIYYRSEWGNPAIRRLLRRVGPEHIADLLTLRRADLQAHKNSRDVLTPLNELEKRIRSLMHEKTVTRLSHLAVDGHTVMKVLNLKSGPMVGSYLNELLEMVTDRPGLNNKKDLLQILLRMKGD